jgi:hypothetical protein
MRVAWSCCALLIARLAAADSRQPPLLRSPIDDRLWVDGDPAADPPLDPPLGTAAVNTNTIYLNNCRPYGCVIRGAANASSLDGTGYQGTFPINGAPSLPAWASTDEVWNSVVECVKDVFAPFGVQITTTNPSPAPHFEIMIAGHPNDVGFSSNVGGVSSLTCAPYTVNSLVLVFQQFWGNSVEDICATAAQELAHSFALDHVIDASDPLTYFSYNGRRYFKNAQVQCGSDCFDGLSPQGLTCTGATSQIHPCYCTNQPTQNSFTTIGGLFGLGEATPPTTKIVSPKLGSVVQAGFTVQVQASDNVAVSRVELYVDGLLTATLAVAPYTFTAPGSLADGTHRVQALAFDDYGASGSASTQVVIGTPCDEPSDCPKSTDTCVGGRCVAGPNVAGGLGTTCTMPNDCISGQCLSDTEGVRLCVESCVVGENQCPSGFGCLENGDLGVCWKGYEEDGGSCAVGGPTGMLSLVFSLGLLGVRRRRRV